MNEKFEDLIMIIDFENKSQIHKSLYKSSHLLKTKTLSRSFKLYRGRFRY